MFGRYLSVILLSLLVLSHSGYTIDASIKSITYRGTGCPENSISTSMSPSSTALTQSLDDLHVAWGPGTRTSDHSKYCLLTVEFAFEEGCARMVVNEGGVIGWGFPDSRYSWPTNITADVTYTRGDNVDAVASNRILWEGSQFDGWYTGRKTVGGSNSSNILSTACGSTSILRINYRISIQGTSDYAGSTAEDPPYQTGIWAFQHTMRAEECTCNA